MSPVEQTLYEYREKLEKMMSKSALRCTSCNRLRKGICFIESGEFLCLDCLMLRKTKELDNDPEYIRRERVYKMHKAIEDYKCRSKT
jgi:late competence protein required for DNA uptake (superfamily II DNA/RNA helicase)